MGKCIWCGRSAGLFETKHESCEQKHESGWATMVGDSRLAVLGKRDSRMLEKQLSDTAAASYIPYNRLKDAMVEGWGLAVEDYLNNGGLDENEERKLVAFRERFGLQPDALDRNGSWTRMLEAAVVRNLLYGMVPEHVKANGNLPITLMATEKLVWFFNVVKYFDGQVPTPVGGYHGARVEVAKGAYYRPYGFRGYPVEQCEHSHVDSGSVTVTTRHVYFVGREHWLRVRYDQIVSFTPYSDGIAIQRDADTARPLVFVTGDGWLIYNLLANIRNVSGW